MKEKLKRLIRSLHPLFPLKFLEIVTTGKLNEEDTNSDTNGEFAFLNSIGKEESCVIVDAGAHTGDWTQKALEAFPKATVHAFEPASYTFVKLKNKHGEDGRVILNRLCLGSESREIELKIFGEGSHINSLYNTGHGIVPVKGTEICTMETLDDYVSMKGIKSIRLLKIDTEGAEMFVLEGAHKCLERGIIDFIQLEYNDTWIDARRYLKDLFALADQYGYVVARILPKGLKRIKDYHWRLERFRYANYVLLKKSTPATL